MMWSTLILSIIFIVLETDPTNALSDTDLYDEQHGNHSFIQPRQASISVDLDARSLTAVTIHTPRFPKKYPLKTQVDWNVKATGQIEFYLPVFKLQPRNKKGHCSDYLKVDDGGIITKYCGKELNGGRYVTATNNIHLTFKSSKKNKKRFNGFNCTISPFSPDCNCGLYTPPVAKDNKIVGGNDTRDNQYPWQAVMVYNDTNILRCGGSLINEQWVLTAAHCTYEYVPSDIQILLGAHCWPNPPSGLLRLDVLNIIQHAGYNNGAYDDDIALLKLETSIDFIHTQFRPVCLPISNTDHIPDEDDVEAAISGFGLLEYDDDDNIPDCLQYGIVDTMPNTLCQSKYPNRQITGNMICAASPGIDSCQQDSGGPMATNATSDSLVDYYVQIGIVSWGTGCAHPDFPGVYARVSAYIDWININTAGFSTCPPP